MADGRWALYTQNMRTAPRRLCQTVSGVMGRSILWDGAGRLTGPARSGPNATRARGLGLAQPGLRRSGPPAGMACPSFLSVILDTVHESYAAQGTWASRTQKHSEARYRRPVDRGAWTAKMTPATTSTSSMRQLLGATDAQTAHHATFSTAPTQHTNYWAPQMRKRHQQEHWPQRPTESSDPTDHAKGRTGDCPGPRKGTTTRQNVTKGVAKSNLVFLSQEVGQEVGGSTQNIPRDKRCLVGTVPGRFSVHPSFFPSVLWSGQLLWENLVGPFLVHNFLGPGLLPLLPF